MGILSGVRVVEFEGLGPGPFCGMLLADHGAEVILIERKGGMETAAGAVFKRGKRSIILDLKNEKARDIALDIASKADALIEGNRPGVMERLGLGPDIIRERNKKIVYGRLTGWGQSGPLSHAAGHDANFIALSGAAWYAGQNGAAPVAAPTMVGDVAGGALYLAIGILGGIIQARETGVGTVVDAAIVDGSAHMMNLLFSLRAAGGLPDERGKSMLDGAHFYETYECADGKWITIGPLEPKFYDLLIEKMGLASEELFKHQHSQAKWESAKNRMREIFKSKDRAYWDDLLRGTDVCYAPVLSPLEAAVDPHIAARKIYRSIDGVMQTAAAPRFDGTPPLDPPVAPRSGAHTSEILTELGHDQKAIEKLREEGVI